MAKKIFTADLHLQPFANDTVELENGITLKLQELLNSIEQVLIYGVNNKIDTVIFGGDIGHHRNTIYTRPFYLFQELLLKYCDKLNYVFIPGNHDGSSLYVGQNSVSLFKTMPNTTVHVYPTVVGNITYIPDSQDMQNDISEADPNDILISHFPLSEAATDSGLKVTTRFTKKDLHKFKLVLLGDYHTHQTVDHIHYPGTLVPMNRGEKGAKGFIVFDDETLKTEFIEVTGFRQYVDIQIDENTNLEEVKQILENKDDFITVHNNLQEIPQEIRNIVKEAAVPIIDKYEPEDVVRGISSSMALGEQMTKYLEINNVPEYDRDRYLQIGLTNLEPRQ